MKLKERLDQLLKDGLASINEKEALYRCFGLIDLTSLEATDNEKSIGKLTGRARSYLGSMTLPPIPAVCVYPVFAGIAARDLSGTGIHTAAVAGAFPHGQSPLELRKAEVDFALKEGADEIDMVISRGRFLAGDYDYVYREISEIKALCEAKHLKVILETGELESEENIRKASRIALDAGADYIKTSTGKTHPAASLEAMLIMLEEIREFSRKTGKSAGIKPAGGIRTAEQALQYYCLVEQLLGREWLNPERFRIGASSLAGDLVEKIREMEE
ncbi:MAG: deoxyribose-phosphate aldolase [Bacteroidota bacterium]|nr:deoxyribose-phosphate aldolase [Bacteroidota bacterium]